MPPLRPSGLHCPALQHTPLDLPNQPHLDQASSAAGMSGSGSGNSSLSVTSSSWPAGVRSWPAAARNGAWQAGQVKEERQKLPARRAQATSQWPPRNSIRQACRQTNKIKKISPSHQCHGCRGRERPQRSGHLPAWQSPNNTRGSGRGSCMAGGGRQRRVGSAGESK